MTMDSKKTLILLYLIACFAGTSFSASCKLLLQDCGSKAGHIYTAMYNETCDQGKAVLKQGSVASIAFTFSPNNAESNLTSKVAGKIGELPYVNFPLGNPDACKDSGLKCPIAANTNVTYSPALDVLKEYPKVQVIVKWELQNKNGEDVFCALIPAYITG